MGYYPVKLNTVTEFPLTKFPFRHTSMIPNTVANFYGTDSEDAFNINLKERTNWIYQDKKIIYNFNSDGLRMKKNLSDVDDDYILFSGSSYGLGIGLAEEDRYSEIVSNETNIDFINCSSPGFSVKGQAINFFNLLSSGYKLPKIFVVEYPTCQVYTFYENDSFLICFRKHLPDDRYLDLINIHQAMVNTNFFCQEAVIYQNMVRSACKSLGIKLVEISFDASDSFTKNYVPNIIDHLTNSHDINFCYSRDYRIIDGNYTAHAGIGLHRMASDLIIKSL